MTDATCGTTSGGRQSLETTRATSGPRFAKIEALLGPRILQTSTCEHRLCLKVLGKVCLCYSRLWTRLRVRKRTKKLVSIRMQEVKCSIIIARSTCIASKSRMTSLSTVHPNIIHPGTDFNIITVTQTQNLSSNFTLNNHPYIHLITLYTIGISSRSNFNTSGPETYQGKRQHGQYEIYPKAESITPTYLAFKALDHKTRIVHDELGAR